MKNFHKKNKALIMAAFCSGAAAIAHLGCIVFGGEWLRPLFPNNSLTFWLVSSGICLTIGLLYAVGTFQMWSRLSVKNAY